LRPDWEAAALLEAQILAQKSPAEAIARCNALSNVIRRRATYNCIWRALLVGEKRYGEAKRSSSSCCSPTRTTRMWFSRWPSWLCRKTTTLAETQLKHLVTLDMPDKSAPYYYLGQLAEEGKRS
jgi:hypothetical protein